MLDTDASSAGEQLRRPHSHFINCVPQILPPDPKTCMLSSMQIKPSIRVETRKVTPLSIDVYVCGTDSAHGHSNSGVFGGLFGTPIVNLPQAAMPAYTLSKTSPLLSMDRLSFVRYGRRADTQPWVDGWSGGCHAIWLVNLLTYPWM